jgi:hypothetical protein
MPIGDHLLKSIIEERQQSSSSTNSKNLHEAFNTWHYRKNGLAQLCCPREQVKIMGHNLTPFKR